MLYLIHQAISMYCWVLIAHCIVSYFPQTPEIVSRNLAKLSEPSLKVGTLALKKLFPNNRGMESFSIMFVLISLHLFQYFLVSL